MAGSSLPITNPRAESSSHASLSTSKSESPNTTVKGSAASTASTSAYITAAPEARSPARARHFVTSGEFENGAATPVPWPSPRASPGMNELCGKAPAEDRSATDTGTALSPRVGAACAPAASSASAMSGTPSAAADMASESSMRSCPPTNVVTTILGRARCCVVRLGTNAKARRSALHSARPATHRPPPMKRSIPFRSTSGCASHSRASLPVRAERG
mmetsp:Transcript_25238/g.76580  ORF Transcript_25238/g.76580 Transcript_25238/m.76580 type:complete len:217 (+) Transcript_25238:372-1022(+)